MKTPNLKFIVKLGVSLLLAFLVSQFLVEKVTFRQAPVIRPSFKKGVQNLPSKIVSQAKKIAHLPKNLLTRRPSLPPPWIAPPIKPTIVAYKPPYFYPPTSTPVPTTPPTPTPLIPTPTATPAFGPSPTHGPSPTPPPYPATPTPTSYVSPTPRPSPTPETSPGEKKTQLLNLINQERQKNTISPVSFNTALNNAAQAHADDLVEKNYFSHVSPDGRDPQDFAREAGYPSWVGENLACGYPHPQAIFNMWMKSEGHRQNMLNPSWHSLGIGYNSGTCGRCRYCWCLMMGAR